MQGHPRTRQTRLADRFIRSNPWRETYLQSRTVITDLLEGQFSNPVRVIGFDTAGPGPAMFLKPPARCADQQRELPEFLHQFVER